MRLILLDLIQQVPHWWSLLWLHAQELYEDKRGVTTVEYGLIAALIAVTIISSISSLGSHLSGTFSKISTAVTR